MKNSSRKPPQYFALEIIHFARFSGIANPAEELGIDQAVLEDPEATVPITVFYDAFERAAERSGRPNFGLRFAIHWTRVAKDGQAALHFLQRSSPTLRVACEHNLRYQRYWNPAEWYDQIAGERTYTVRYRCWGPEREAHVLQAEKMAVLTALVPRGVDPACRPLSVAFPHAPSGDQERLARVLGVMPSYGAPWTEVVLPIEVMDKPLPERNPALFAVVDRYLKNELARLPRDDQPYSSRVFTAVQTLLHEDAFSHGKVARVVGCGARTLTRRLADEGTSLREIIDEVRKARAVAFLESKMSISEVAFLLGYSEPAAFQHAFRRWHGMSPKAWQARNLSTGEAIASSTSND